MEEGAPQAESLRLGENDAFIAPGDGPPRPEVRFGLVLYGGVSLAIYIYGVVVEFWRMVKASQKVEESAYSKLLDEAGATAVVDIISGTSAGGINGVLLAKALAHGSDLDAAESLWLDEASLTKLIRPRSDREPKSLLRSDHFSNVLTDGLAKMDERPGPKLVRAVDLFVTGTRLEPWIRDFPTDLGGSIKTADYRKVFHLERRVANYNPQVEGLGFPRNDLTDANNSLLVEVARATSAFPLAFEPQLIERTKVTEDLYLPKEPPRTYFSDGGILANKPFTDTIATILKRAADAPVERWLVSVEPDPEHFKAPKSTEPQVDEVIAKSVFGIPRYQSIAADLARLDEHRARVDRQNALLSSIDAVGPPFMGMVLSRAYDDERFSQLIADLAYAIGKAAALDDAARKLVADGLRAGAHLDRELAMPDVSYARRRLYHLIKHAGALARQSVTLGLEDEGAIAMALGKLWARFDSLGAAVWSALDNGRVTGLGGVPAESLIEASGDVYSWLVAELSEAVRPDLTDDIEELPDLAIVATILDGISHALAERSHREDGRPPLTVAEIFAHYRDWDQYVIPCDPELGVSARDQIRLARVSPADATYIRKTAARKLAGDQFFHFGGFLKEEWRKNDILWGRLDAAETIVRMVLTDKRKTEAEVDEQIRLVQTEIVKDKLPQALPYYRTYLENEYKVGDETLKDVDDKERAGLALDAADVARNMVGQLGQASAAERLRGAYAWIAHALGFVLGLVRWPVHAIWAEDDMKRRFASLVVLFAGAWSVVATLLVIGPVDGSEALWTAIAIGFAIYLIWSLFENAPVWATWLRIRFKKRI